MTYRCCCQHCRALLCDIICALCARLCRWFWRWHCWLHIIRICLCLCCTTHTALVIIPRTCRAAIIIQYILMCIWIWVSLLRFNHTTYWTLSNKIALCHACCRVIYNIYKYMICLFTLLHNVAITASVAAICYNWRRQTCGLCATFFYIIMCVNNRLIILRKNHLW